MSYRTSALRYSRRGENDEIWKETLDSLRAAARRAH